MVIHSVTLTFRVDPTCGLHTLLQLKSLLHILNHDGIDFIFFPEIGEKGQWHLHGIVQYTNVNKNYVRGFYGYWTRTVGFTKIKELLTFKDELQWLYYCRKDQWLNIDYLTKLNYKNYGEIKKSKKKNILDMFIDNGKKV